MSIFQHDYIIHIASCTLVTPMNENAPRSVCLVVLMIAAIALPLMQTADPPPMLEKEPPVMETPQSPCLGHDACTGEDAGGYNARNEICPPTQLNASGGNGCPVIDLSSYIDYGSGETTTVFWGSLEGFSSNTDDDDVYSFLVPWGYGVNATFTWNNSNDMADGGMGLGAGSCTSYSCPGGRIMYDGDGDADIALTSMGTDVSGQIVELYIDCYYAYCPVNTANPHEYRLEIVTWPSDGGGYGDWSQGEEILSMYDGCTFTSHTNCDGSATYWPDHKTDTFTLGSGESADVQYHCQYSFSFSYYCFGSTQYYVTITKPDGTVDSFQGVAQSAQTGSLGTYSDPGTYTVYIQGGNYYSSYYGGYYGYTSIRVMDANPTYPIYTMTTTTLAPTISVFGAVGATDTNDYFAIKIPGDAFANVSLNWDASADLDLRSYSSNSFSSMLDSSFYSKPEIIDFGTATNTTIYVKVSYYGPGSSASAAGYQLTLNLLPTVFPPCWVQDDAGSGADAVDTRTDGPTAITGTSGSFTGMLCDSQDREDWYEFSLSAHQGLWAKLEWTKNDTSDTLQLYQYMSRYNSQYSVSSSTSSYFDVQAVSSNESYYYRAELSSPSIIWLRVRVGNLVDDTEYNYTLTWSTYNQSETWNNPSNDAGSGVDAGDSSYSISNPVLLPSVNNTYTGHGHDYQDQYDQYKLYVPPNYGIHLVVHFPEHNDIDVFVRRNVAGTSLSSISTSYNNNPEDIWTPLTYGGYDFYIIIMTDRGSGPYTMEIDLITADTDPDPEDDCGTGVDAHDLVYSTNWADYTWLNNSNQIDANGDANDTGGVCTGWISDVIDERDYYNILIPPGKYMQLNLSWESQGITVYSYIYKCQIQTLPCSYPANGAYYVSQGSSATGSISGSTGLWFTQGGWARIGIYSYSVVNLTYTMDIQFLDLSGLVGGIQDDASSGLDAGSGASDAIHVNTYVNQTGDTLEWQGWNHPVVDTTDRYTFDVPANYGFEVCAEHDGVQYGNSGSTVLLILDLYGTQSSPLPINTMVYYAVNPMCWSTNQSSGSYYGGEEFMIGVRNWFASQYPGSTGQDYNITVTFHTLDADGDGWYDDMEVSCGTDPYDNSSVPQDTDADGICDTLDSDTDGDGVVDSEDEFPNDANESSDLDGDGIGDNSDNDLDGDGWNNTDEVDCLTDPLDSAIFPTDFDNDTICDVIDPDDDNDGYDDIIDVFPLNATEWADFDNDFIGDNLDLDDDNDGYDDELEIACNSDAYDVMDIPVDQDLDGICDPLDTDLDGDGYDNDVDAFPQDPLEWIDTDGDGYGDNEDTDDDNDLYLDADDAFPLDSSEWIDTDGDDVGDNADLNDDGDAWTDAEEAACGSDSLDADSVPADYDNDGLCDKVDTDDDGDGWPDVDDAFPYDATEYTDLDGDGIGDYTDTDDDNDGWLDTEEPNCNTDPMDMFSVPADNDRDHQCDIVDPDDDNDGTLDIDDDFPMNPAEQNDLDGDGMGDNADPDDDGDFWLDVTETICAAAGGYGDPMNAAVKPTDNDPGPDATAGEDGIWGTDDDTGTVGDLVCDAIDPDWDNDGFPNPADPDNPVCNADLCEDFFPYDPGEWHDANGDGLGDNDNELTFMDDFQAEPMPFIAALLAIIGVALIARRGFGGEDDDDFDDDADYTEEFMDDDELDEAIDEAFDDEDDEDED